MSQATTTVKVDENGRCTIPVEVRDRLGFDGDNAYVEMTVKYDE